MQNQKISKRKDGSIRVQSINDEPSMTQLQFADDVDINKIVNKYQKTGLLPELREGVFMDLTSVPDFQGALNSVIRAQDAFDVLPADIRTKFDNDPQKLITYLSDDKNYEESVKLGLRNPKPVDPTQSINANLNAINDTLKSQSTRKKATDTE